MRVGIAVAVVALVFGALTVVLELGEEPARDLEYKSIALVRALLHSDGEALRALTAPDWAQSKELRGVVERVGAEVSVDVWPLTIDAPPGELRAICVTFSGDDEDVTGGLMFRHQEDAWLAWEFRPGMVGCK